MATLQSVNGKAPSNAQVGDKIVTNGGTYQITGQNADGSWISQKVSDTNKYTQGSSSSSSSSRPSSGSSSSSSKPPANFSGSSNSVGVYDDWQQAIKDQMNANSQAWWNATSQAEKDALHQANVELAAQLGGSVNYDGTTGTWSGSAGAPMMPELPQYTPTDNSDYLEQMAAAYLEKQKEALKQAYEQNLSNLQAEQDKLGANYQAARNQEAADNALAQQRWNETAAAYGLNSGTQGQAALSYSNQLQSDLSALQAAESAANAEIERYRTDLGKEYQSAMTQAIEENNYQLYQLLYQEAVRVDQALQNQSQFNASLALQQYQTMLDKYYNDMNISYTQDQASRAEQFDAAALLAQMGDYSAYGELYGWDDATIQKMNSLWQQANMNSYSGGSSSGSSYGSSSGASFDDNLQSLYAAAYQSSNPEAFISNNYKKYGLTSSSGLASGYYNWIDSIEMSNQSGSTGTSNIPIESLVSQVRNLIGRNRIDDALEVIASNWSRLSTSERNRMQSVLGEYGYSYEE